MCSYKNKLELAKFTFEMIQFLFELRELATFPTLPNLVSVENDATLAKSACAVGYAYRRRIEQYSMCSKIMDTAVKQLVAVRIPYF